ncbi:hypothetical protein FOMPIDRAFT_88769 [Fomitopsis schrenkii]|uniref:Uncharacterized protein n=1 Tax=Fomitopsis schrenkii TaxID=2126942 RepID=S8EBU0_FOMSC|nr:hypothetical protein FOMPIDRAFT_88769 [Fomitopsis schrenkii]
MSTLHRTGTFDTFYAARVITLVPDILVVVLTWMKTHRLITSAREFGFLPSLPGMVLRSGVYYFAAAAVCSVGLLILTGTSGATISTADLVALSAILMSRFMLNLRREAMNRNSMVQTASQMRSSIMGNFGEWLDVDDVDDDCVDDYEPATPQNAESAAVHGATDGPLIRDETSDSMMHAGEKRLDNDEVLE